MHGTRGKEKEGRTLDEVLRAKRARNEAVIGVEKEETNGETLMFSTFFLNVILVANIVTIVKTQNI